MLENNIAHQNELTVDSDSKFFVVIDITCVQDKLCFAFKEFKTKKILLGDINITELENAGFDPNEIVYTFKVTGMVNPVIEELAWNDAKSDN